MSNFKIKFKSDCACCNPRTDFSNLGKIFTFSSYFVKNEFDDIDNFEITTFDKDFKKLQKLGYIVYPLSVIDHSQVSFHLARLHDWDSGCIGFYLAKKEDVREDFGVKRITKKIKSRVEEIFKQEIQYLNVAYNGGIYEFTITDADGDFIDSLTGIYDINLSNQEVIGIVRGYSDVDFSDEEILEAWENRS